ncbi:hypothetical protein ALP73_200184 [Pseudomonas coronafaciens pv. garcae]|uniref:Lipoprotein n=2 Tax=Pseudomonas syringae group TaxID=136849 RepID=A0AB37QLX1_9PSED|nr:hypothetical protein [Pseudomonas coronafaciens]RMR98275.1 hypothetical protein ALP74_200278 [Pseudomonas coronafaciens pv. garcae]RMS09071.1 hypothetical protein ALP73_200184 [Pseudomonas coronafaciens pv. garcae]RMS09602.1 hypothetical protein ALP71_200047 [Pseudomonas coronafaciens pv. garcae]
MSFGKLELLGIAAFVMAGCTETGPKITIPAGSHIVMKLNYIGDSLIGDLLPVSNLKNEPTDFGKELVERHCSMGITTEWNDNLDRHVGTSAALVCDGVEHLELEGELVDAQGAIGQRDLTLGDQINFLVKKTVTIK